MNVKLHTPKSLKAGSGLSSLKQFLLSLFATTVSIALTFGTAGIIDYLKKQSEKREIVMMVMYDMYNSLEMVQRCDSSLIESIGLQLELAKDTTRFQKLWLRMAVCFPVVEYTETTERIFSSNIETINTVGNVLFTENVAEFYQTRRLYKTHIGDSIETQIKTIDISASVKNALSFDYTNAYMISCGFVATMQSLFDQCKQMMDVSDADLQAYRKEREQIENNISDRDKQVMQGMNRYQQLKQSVDSAKNALFR
jgi:hypothetical protein